MPWCPSPTSSSICLQKFQLAPWDPRCFHGALLFTLSQGAAEEKTWLKNGWDGWNGWKIGWKIAWQFRKWKRFKNGFNIFGKCDGKTVGLQRCHVGFPNILDDIPMFIGSSWFFASISSEFPDLPSGYLTFNIAMENHHF
jgi:hypothetical protein